MPEKRTDAVLSVQQPYAWALVHGWKPVENRSRRLRYVGHLLIHAGKRELRADVSDVLFDIAVQTGETVRDLRALYEHEKYLGGIVGSVEMVGCVNAPEKAAKLMARHNWDRCKDGSLRWNTPAGRGDRVQFLIRSASRWWVGPFGFVMVDGRPFDHPIKLRGRLGLWYEEDVFRHYNLPPDARPR